MLLLILKPVKPTITVSLYVNYLFSGKFNKHFCIIVLFYNLDIVFCHYLVCWFCWSALYLVFLATEYVRNLQ